MRIVQICTNASSGSVGSIVRNLCKSYKEYGHDYLICFGRGKHPEGYNAYKFDNSFDIYSHALLARISDSDGLHSKRATSRLIKKLRDFKPDIIHIHCLHGYYINYPMLLDYIKKNRIRIVWTMHDCWAFTGHCCYFDYAQCNHWKYHCEDCSLISTYPKSYVDRSYKNFEVKKKLFSAIDDCTIVTPSLWLANLLKQSFLNNFKIVTINNGIDIDTFKPTYDDNVLSKYNIDLNKKAILCLASIWTDRKGLNDVIELANYLLQDTQLIIVGITKKQSKKIPNNVICIPKTENVHELAVIYTFASVFFNPTYEDNYPTVNIESMACGTPVVTYDTGGSPEIVKKTHMGKIIEQKDYNALIEFIEYNKKHKFNFINIENLSNQIMSHSYLNIYQKEE